MEVNIKTLEIGDQNINLTLNNNKTNSLSKYDQEENASNALFDFLCV